MVAKPFPILFISASRIGDAVLASGLLKRLVDDAPNATFTIVTSALSAPLFQDTPRLHRLIVLEKEKYGLHWLRLWREARKTRWGLVLDMRGSGIARLLSARRRAIRRSPAPGSEPVHKVIEAARVLGLEDDLPTPFLFTTAERDAAAAELVRGEGPILAMGPAASWMGKSWPAEKFAVVAAELMNRSDSPMAGGRLLLLGGPDDRMACEPVRRSVSRSRLIDLVGKVDLLTAYATLKHARLFIGNDSGLMHLAAAAGAPTIGLFGPSDERLYAPWGPVARAVRGPRDFETVRATDPGLNQMMNHMADLPVDWVSKAARELLVATGGGGAKDAGDPDATDL